MTSFLGSKSASARNARRSVLGIKRIPDDSFTKERARLEEFSYIVSITLDCTNAFVKSLEKISSKEEFSELREFYGPEQVERFESAKATLSSLSSSFEGADPQLRDVCSLLEGFQSRVRDVNKKLEERDEAYWEKVHYEEKMNRLSDKERVDGERVDRNVKKMSQAITNYAESEKILREARALVAGSGESLDSVLVMYSRFLTSMLSELN